MDTQLNMLGRILWLWSCSALHKRWPLESAVHYVIPAIEHQQYMLMTDDCGNPRGYVSWAWLDSDTEKRYILNPNSLQTSDWNKGDRLWFIDFIAPFGFKDAAKLRRLMGQMHGKHYLGRSIRLRSSQKARLVEHTGGSIDLNKSEQLKTRFFEEARQFFSKK